MCPCIQNEIIGICGSLIQKNIVTEVNNLGVCLSLLTILVMFPGQNNSLWVSGMYMPKTLQGRTSFVPFWLLLSLRASFRNVRTALDMWKLVGLGYDRGALIAGKFNEVQARFIEIRSMSVYVHFVNHIQNFALSSSVTCQECFVSFEWCLQFFPIS